MKRYYLTVGGQMFDVQVHTDPRQKKVSVEVDGELFEVLVDAAPVTVTQPVDAASDSEEYPKAITGKPTGNSITAPLPGVVKSIAVTPGQRVATGDEILVIEAMKMDNVIRATGNRVIGEIHVSEGHRVAHGQLLCNFRDSA